MKPIFRIVLPLAVLIVRLNTSAIAQTDSEDFYRPWVDYRNGEISVDFDQTPVTFALYAIQAKTGFQIVVPSTPDIKVVNLKLQRQPLEPAVRSLISKIGYKNFALLYDEQGHPRRAVVLGARENSGDAAVPAVKNEPTAPLTENERDKLQKELERWSDLKQEERGRIEDRLKNLAPSEERDQLVNLYGRQLLGLAQ
ncbi:MAG: hypothetical protein ACM3SP_13385 [Chloroflexota bacterium]